MTRTLPTIIYKKRKYYVDFRMEEIRDVKTARAIKFTDLPEGKDSRVKKHLRVLRFRTSGQYYIHGLDD
ncbi:MAG: hypothetical protein V1715_04405 [bacterium]